MIPHRTARYWFLLAFASIWMLALVAPVILAGGSRPVGEWSYLFFRSICHQNPERSFFWLQKQVSVCHRCFGIYLGFWVGALLLPRVRSVSTWLLCRPRRVLLFALPMSLDVLLENSAASRFLTGFTAGLPVALFAWVAMEQMPCRPGHLLRRFHESRAT